MDFLIELVFDLILDGSEWVIKDKRIPKYIRYPLAGLVILFYSGIILGLIVLGTLIMKSELWAGIFLLAVGVFLAVMTVIRIIVKVKKGR